MRLEIGQSQAPKLTQENLGSLLGGLGSSLLDVGFIFNFPLGSLLTVLKVKGNWREMKGKKRFRFFGAHWPFDLQYKSVRTGRNSKPQYLIQRLINGKNKLINFLFRHRKKGHFQSVHFNKKFHFICFFFFVNLLIT